MSIKSSGMRSRGRGSRTGTSRAILPCSIKITLIQIASLLYQTLRDRSQ
ncbi:hypothetical protein [Nostoc sp.]